MSRLSLSLVVLLACFCVAHAAVVEVKNVLPGRGYVPITITDTAKDVLSAVVTAQLQGKAALQAIPECLGGVFIKIDAAKYFLCNEVLVKDAKAYAVDASLLLDIIYGGEKSSGDATKRVYAANTAGGKLAAAELTKTAPVEQTVAFLEEKRQTKSRSRYFPLEPRFADERAKVSPAVYSNPNAEFPALQGNVDRTITNQPNHDYNCYGYAANSRRWGATGCYGAAGSALTTAWGAGWCAANTNLLSNVAADPCVQLLAAVDADTFHAADDPLHPRIKVAVFAHMFVTGIQSVAQLAGSAVHKSGFSLFCDMDYHYHREDSAGGWSDKNGNTAVRAQFANPVTKDNADVMGGFNRAITELNAGRNFADALYHSKFCGYRWAANRHLEGLVYNAVGGNTYCP